MGRRRGCRLWCQETCSYQKETRVVTLQVRQYKCDSTLPGIAQTRERVGLCLCGYHAPQEAAGMICGTIDKTPPVWDLAVDTQQKRTARDARIVSSGANTGCHGHKHTLRDFFCKRAIVLCHAVIFVLVR